MSGGASFRVYSPSELQHVQLRPAHRPVPQRGFFEELKDTVEQAKAMGPRKLLKWAAVAVATTLFLFTVLLVIANATDDTLVAKKDRLAAIDEDAKSANDTKRSTTLQDTATATSTSAVVEPEPTDFELPDDSVPPQRTAAKTRPKPKQGKRSIVKPAKTGSHPLF